MATTPPMNRMSITTREDFLNFLDILSKLQPNQSKKALLGRTRFRSKSIKPCYLLLLPPELRNLIYRTLYPLNNKTPGDRYINPFDIENPDPNFLLSCSQIYHEARGYYEQARGHLWMDSNFLIHKRCIKPSSLSSLDPLDLDLISRITIIISHDIVAELIDFRGGWKIIHQDGKKVEWVCVHQRLAGVWKGMTWCEFFENREKMENALMGLGRFAGMKDQMMQILLVGKEEVKRIAVRTFWRSVCTAAAAAGGSGSTTAMTAGG